jgi:hypothetical protein
MSFDWTSVKMIGGPLHGKRFPLVDRYSDFIVKMLK